MTGTTAYRKTIDRLRGTLLDIGFLELCDLEGDLPPTRLEYHYSLGDQLFSIDEDILKRYEDPSDDRQQGYTPFGVEYGDPRCYWMVGRGVHPYKPNIFPEDLLPSYRRSSMFLFSRFDMLLLRVALGVEYAFNLPPGELLSRLKNGDDRMRHMRYKVGPEGGQAATAHGDIDVLTGVCPRERGLRVRPKGGELTPVAYEPGHMVVNTGEQLSTYLRTWHGIDIPYTEHDVVLPPGMPERQSIAYFKHFFPTVVVDKETGEASGDITRKRLQGIGHGQ